MNTICVLILVHPLVVTTIAYNFLAYNIAYSHSLQPVTTIAYNFYKQFLFILQIRAIFYMRIASIGFSKSFI